MRATVQIELELHDGRILDHKEALESIYGVEVAEEAMSDENVKREIANFLSSISDIELLEDDFISNVLAGIKVVDVSLSR